MGRDALAVAVYRLCPGLSRSRARAVVDDVLEELVDGLARDRKVLLSGFGVFRLVDKAPRTGRNPKTGEEHAIAARTIVVFKSAATLRASVERGGRRRCAAPRPQGEMAQEPDTPDGSRLPASAALGSPHRRRGVRGLASTRSAGPP